MLSARRLLRKLFGYNGRPTRAGAARSAPDGEWASLQVGDQLIAKDDVYLQTHRRGVWYADLYPNYRQFAAGKVYPIVQVRARTGVVFVMDDGNFRRAVNEFQGRRFIVKCAAIVLS